MPDTAESTQAFSRDAFVKRSKVAMKVLLIEDHEDTALIIARGLETVGHSVARANSVASAVAVLTREQFDVIISDIGLPDGNGIPLIYAIREFCHVPAIALTGYGNPEDIERCLRAGFNRHLTKPVSFETLRQTIAEVCAHATEK
jgi:CheY-like chemotaxis protein